jgi:hypothetical protein
VADPAAGLTDEAAIAIFKISMESIVGQTSSWRLSNGGLGRMLPAKLDVTHFAPV